jgi:peptidyl-dipeptidase A
MRTIQPLFLIATLFLGGALWAQQPGPSTTASPTVKNATQPTLAEAEKFVNDSEATLEDLNVKAARTQWVNETFITEDTDAIAADYGERIITEQTRIAEQIKRYNGMKFSPEMQRKYELLKLSLFSLTDEKERAEISTLATKLGSEYGEGVAKPLAGKHAGQSLPIGEVEQIMAGSRDPEELQQIWAAWHEVGAPMRSRYVRYVELQNKGARELGYKDMGAMWRSGYDMDPDAFAAEVDRLWEQVRPLYESLHAYVRTQLVKKYGAEAVDANGMIRADLLGNPWAQEWGNIYPLVEPKSSVKSIDITALLKAKNVDELGMVHYAENFFKSLGFAPLPETFWKRSLFLKPRDREVVCHASAWDVDNKDDLRLKMCIQMRDEDFVTVHHELGHNFYQRAYNFRTPLFRNGANDGFHEAIGDTIALSITPEYLKQVGLLDKVPETDDTALLLHKALDKIGFLPFGLLIDKWRWQVFSGEIAPANYNEGWWKLREHYQGIFPPVARSEKDFDPGAKYHIAANVPYMRYFLADILQFQFFRAMCQEAGQTGPLHRCSFYNDKKAGAKFAAMLELGQSKPWPEALKILTGQDHMDASAIMDYFAPLKKWLDEQNAAAGVTPGWKETTK